ncbi:MAG: ferritin-like domain-containing protein [Bacteroidia bacterium]
MKNLEDLFLHELKDLYSAEDQLVEALPKMEKAATDNQLKRAFSDHLEETKRHKQRLEEIGEKLGHKLTGEKCKAMAGLVKEGEDMIDEDAEARVKDAGLIAAAQRVEHYEISGYGTAHHFAMELGHNDLADLLNQTLNEEKNADQKLNNLATQRINQKAEA